MKQLVIMPGGFHPFHAGHAALYQSAQQAFPGADVYVAATNDTSTRPFPFAVKEKLAQLAGVEKGRFTQVKSPFRAEEITHKYDPNNTQLIFVRSEKDAGSPPRPGGTKKDGTPSYLQPYNDASDQPLSQQAYMAYLPTVEFGPGMTSATEIRNSWPKLNEKRKQALVMSLYPKTQTNPKLAQTVVKLLDAAIGGQVTENLDEAIGGNYLYHATSASGLKGMLSSGSIRSATAPQAATSAQTRLPTVSVTRDWGYANGAHAQSQMSGIGRDAILVLDRNAVESNFKTLGTSQNTNIRGLAFNPYLRKDGEARSQNTDPAARANAKAKAKYAEPTAKAGGEFEEAVVVPKGALPLKGTMVGFWINPKSELIKDPAIMNDPRRLDMVRPNQFVKATQQQGVAEGPIVSRIVHPRKISIYVRSGINKPPVLVATDIPYEILDRYIAKVISKYPRFKATDFSFKPSDKVSENQGWAATYEALKPDAFNALQQAKQRIEQDRQQEISQWEQDFRANTASRFAPRSRPTAPTPAPVAQPGEKHAVLKARLAQLDLAIKKQQQLDALTQKLEYKGLLTPAMQQDLDTRLYVRGSAADNYQALNQKLDRALEIATTRLRTNKLAFREDADYIDEANKQ